MAPVGEEVGGFFSGRRSCYDLSMNEKETVTLELEDYVIAELRFRAGAAGCTIDEILEDILRRQMALEDENDSSK